MYTVYASDLNFNGINEKAIKVYEPIFSEKKDIYKLVGSPDICISHINQFINYMFS